MPITLGGLGPEITSAQGHVPFREMSFNEKSLLVAKMSILFQRHSHRTNEMKETKKQCSTRTLKLKLQLKLRQCIWAQSLPLSLDSARLEYVNYLYEVVANYV